MKRSVWKEFFGHFDIMVMCLLLLVGIGLTLPHLQQEGTWIALGIGMIAYAVSEYMIHRFFFHLKPPRHPLFLKLLKRLHYDHHVDPNNLRLLFLPIWYSLPLISIAMLIAHVISRDGILTIAFGTGVISYLLAYEWMHYVAIVPSVH